MAGHIEDRWFKSIKQPDGTTARVKTERYGSGLRYRARYVGPDGNEKSKSFPDRQKRQAELWLSHVNADMSDGTYVDPKAARVTFKQYATRWLASQTTDPATRVVVEQRLRLHAFPRIGARPLGAFRPEHMREFVSALEDDPMAGGYARAIYGDVRAVLSSAVDDGHLTRNPCSAKSVRPPAAEERIVTPWSASQVFGVRGGLPDRYRAVVDLGAGCGLRQGEIFGLALDAVDFERARVRVIRQVKRIRGKAVFAPPKCGRERDVPLPASVAAALRTHIETFKPVPVTLPWKTPDGPEVTYDLLFTNRARGIVWRSNFNAGEWKRALAAAHLIPEPEPGDPYAAAPEHGMHALRHFYASVLLDAGENIKAVSQYLGHADPALTLRVYTHLMPGSRDRAMRAVDAVFGYGPAGPDGPETAQSPTTAPIGHQRSRSHA